MSFISGYAREQANLRDMLLRFKTKLRVLSITFWNDIRFDDHGDPIILLEGVAPHLEALRVAWASFASYEGPVFLCLKVLSCAEVCYMHVCAPLIRAFPNLDWLEGPEWSEVEALEVEEIRMENRETQQRLRWHQLALLRGDVISLYGLALQCLVISLRVDVGGEGRAAAMFNAVLRDSLPIHLMMNVHRKFQFAPNMFAGAVSRLSDISIEILVNREGLSPQHLFVRTLSIFLRLCRIDSTRLVSLQDSIIATLVSTKLIHFQLTLVWC